MRVRRLRARQRRPPRRAARGTRPHPVDLPAARAVCRPHGGRLFQGRAPSRRHAHLHRPREHSDAARHCAYGLLGVHGDHRERPDVPAEPRAFRAIEAETRRAIETAEAIDAENHRIISELRSRVRGLRLSVARPAESPSVAAIEQRLRAEARVQELEDLSLLLGHLENELASLAEAARVTQGQLGNLPEARLTGSEQARLTTLETSFLDQLRAYGLESFPIAELAISRDTFRPEREGVDLGFDPSASDGIRIVWAYLLGLLETARAFKTNHSGLLIFDEPRQQSAAERSLAELLAGASSARDSGQQVIFATSEPRERIAPAIQQLNVQFLDFEGRLLRKRPP